MTQHTDQERTEFEAWLPNAYRQPQEVYTVHNMEVAFIAGMQASRRSQTVPHGWKPVPIELLERIQESLGSFISDQGWSQSDMDTADALDGLLASTPHLPAQPGWCDGCNPGNCCGCGIASAGQQGLEQVIK